MATQSRVALIGDFNPSAIAHQAIPGALRLSAYTGHVVEAVWIHTASISNVQVQLREFDGVWCAPDSPYTNMEGVLEAIRFARESGRPFLGTCGGFQHALIEYARNVCNMRTADHAETNPHASVLLIATLACSLVEQSEEIELHGGLVQKAYGVSRITEGYHCNYGLNREYEADLFRNGLTPTAHNLSGEVRGVELSAHPFFVATLFQHERRALCAEIPPLVKAFVTCLSQ